MAKKDGEEAKLLKKLIKLYSLPEYSGCGAVTFKAKLKVIEESNDTSNDSSKLMTFHIFSCRLNRI